MCNAWNHPPNCSCGWGGFGYLGSGSQKKSIGNFFSLGCTLSSYTNPNANCPVCGDSVFFYQSPYGGRVFFDELGPPWPKHPCTDKSNKSIARSKLHNAGQSGKYQWQKDGWSPLLDFTVSIFTPEVLRVSGVFNGDEIIFYINKTIFSRTHDFKEFLMQSHIHIKSQSNNIYQLALFTPELRPTTTLGYVSSNDVPRSGLRR